MQPRSTGGRQPRCPSRSHHPLPRCGPHARTQSVRFTQGPWERVLDLTSVHVDTTPGPMTISGLHRDRVFAADVCVAQAERARLARTRDTSVH
ncbi:MAG: PH domain-containing protein [Actinobacteria bacterium]|nr:PH domain-containing protein [Actinomycetota bacterium]